MVGEQPPGQGEDPEGDVHRKPQRKNVLEAHAQGQRQGDGERRKSNLIEMKEEVRCDGEKDDLLFVFHVMSSRSVVMPADRPIAADGPPPPFTRRSTVCPDISEMPRNPTSFDTESKENNGTIS